jgi:glycosyltransferase involved in cell wall biosynthesis
MKNLNILHLRSSEFFGGPERAIIGQCRSLTEFNVLCGSFVRRGRRSRFLDECREHGIETVIIQESFPGDFRAVGRIRRLIRRLRVNLVITHDYKSNLFTYHAVRKTNARQVAHFRGKTAEDLKDRIYNLINYIYLKKIPRILTVSSTSREFLVKKGIRPGAIRVVPNAIECQNPDRARPDGNRDRGAVVKVVAAGRLSYEKGYDILLKAISSIKDKVPDFVVSIYGHGPEKGNLLRLVEELGVSDRVRFCGFIDDVKPVFRESDFLILPSRSEGMPNVILEAWSQQLGVLSTAVGGVPEMIEDNVSGLLSTPDDAEALADRLMYAIEHPDKMAEFGRKGFEIVRERYSYEKQAELLENIYTEFLEDGVQA